MVPLHTTTTVESDGSLRLQRLPFREGQVVEVIVRPLDDDMTDLAAASESGLEFWDNSIDDQVWNDALPPA